MANAHLLRTTDYYRLFLTGDYLNITYLNPIRILLIIKPAHATEDSSSVTHVQWTKGSSVLVNQRLDPISSICGDS